MQQGTTQIKITRIAGKEYLQSIHDDTELLKIGVEQTHLTRTIISAVAFFRARNNILLRYSYRASPEIHHILFKHHILAPTFFSHYISDAKGCVILVSVVLDNAGHRAFRRRNLPYTPFSVPKISVDKIGISVFSLSDYVFNEMPSENHIFTGNSF
jgi:hypothetical protein